MADSFLVRLPKGMDLLEAIAEEFRKRSISKASFSLVGAVERAVVGFYDLGKKEYKNTTLEGDYEIAACMGNVSIKDGEVFVHAHITLSGDDYRAFGGHLMPGTVLFAAELCGTPLPGDPLVREFDEATGLYLWGGTRPEKESE
ncbi:MAG: DNA-binding protein [Desulfomonilaceae bacterium]|nr:DNA-binding protein [Desulfomonilaceae bacterium]